MVERKSIIWKESGFVIDFNKLEVKIKTASHYSQNVLKCDHPDGGEIRVSVDLVVIT